MIITIDGPGGSGKSTIAKRLANKLKFHHIDTGAMYRAITWFLIKYHIPVSNEKKIQEALKDFDLQIKQIGEIKTYYVNNFDVTYAIRSIEVTNAVSEVASKPLVREFLVEKQREIGSHKDVVCEGRDIGSVVFPQAELKIYLDASNEVRAKRRFKELQEKFPDDETIQYENILADLEKRDLVDSSRKHSPLIKPKDAILIDTSNLSIDEVINKIVDLYEKKQKT